MQDVRKAVAFFCLLLFLLRPVDKDQGKVDGFCKGLSQPCQSQPPGLAGRKIHKFALQRYRCSYNWPGLISLPLLFSVSVYPLHS